jgi:hypothetical protein
MVADFKLCPPQDLAVCLARHDARQLQGLSFKRALQPRKEGLGFRFLLRTQLQFRHAATSVSARIFSEGDLSASILTYFLPTFETLTP